MILRRRTNSAPSTSWRHSDVCCACPFELRDPQHLQDHDQDGVGGRIDRVHEARPVDADQDSGQRRPGQHRDLPRRVDQCERLWQLLARHQGGNERLARGLVECGSRSGQYDGHQNLPRHDVAAQRQRRQACRDHHGHRLRVLQKPAPVPAIGQDAAERAEDQQRHRLRGADEPGLGNRAGQLVDVIEIGRNRSTGADLREDDTCPVEVEIAVS